MSDAAKVKLLPLAKLNAAQWEQLHLAYYSPELNHELGVERPLLPPMDLPTFFEAVMKLVTSRTVAGWVAFDKEDFVGYCLLLRNPSLGELEVITLIPDSDLHPGLGGRMTLTAGRHAFDKWDAEWVLAFVFKEPKVRDMLIRAGFKPFSSFLVIDRETYQARWARS